MNQRKIQGIFIATQKFKSSSIMNIVHVNRENCREGVYQGTRLERGLETVGWGLNIILKSLEVILYAVRNY